jgi:hypothetical protein
MSAKIVRVEAAQKKGGIKQWGSMYAGVSKTCYEIRDEYGRVRTGLSPDDEKRLSALIKRDLSPESSFWVAEPTIVNGQVIENMAWSFFPYTLSAEGKILDLSNPYQEIEYLYLISGINPFVALNESQLSLEKKFLIVDKEQEAVYANKATEKKLEAYMLLGKMKADESKLAGILKLYGRWERNMPLVVMLNTLTTLAEADLDKFLRIASDTDQAVRIFIEDLFLFQIINKDKTTNIIKYGKVPLGTNRDMIVEFFKEELNNPVAIELQKELQERKAKAVSK